ncbi:MAG: LysR family transcriptional regulator [Lentisphaerae bacterium]|nr:LysR family transcriptional regulator [Lentisphaerota bacterium]MCP4100913.1 LysR family transcriptional regulator [Lentisphaerota bacterium]
MKTTCINLNLLTILDAVLTEQNVTHAAQKINLSQPRVSNALKELRDIFGDELLIRNRHGQMNLTTKGRELQKETKDIINRIETLFEANQPFKPSVTALNLNIAMSDYISVAFLPFLTSYLKKFAPNITLSIFNIEYVTNKNRNKIYDSIDFVLGSEALLKSNDEFYSEFLFEDEIVCAANTSHSIFRHPKVTNELFNSFPHIFITPYDIASRDYRDDFLRMSENAEVEMPNDNGSEDSLKISNTGNTTMPVSRIMIACNMLANSDMICIAPKRILNPVYEYFNLNMKSFPFFQSKIRFYQYWKKNTGDTQHLKWLRETIMQLANEL